MKLPKLFSLKNSTRFYKVKIKGSSGTIVFSEMVKRSFVTELLLKNLKQERLNGERVRKISDEVHVVEDKKQLSFFQPMFKGYVDEVRQSLGKKNISIVNYFLRKVIISPNDEKSLNVESEVEVEVAI